MYPPDCSARPGPCSGLITTGNVRIWTIWRNARAPSGRKPRISSRWLTCLTAGYPGADQGHRWQTGFVQTPVNRLDAVFPMAAAVALDLIRQGEVRDQWVMPSVLPKMSIGALACHLGRQVVRAAEVLPMATDVLPLETVRRLLAAGAVRDVVLIPWQGWAL